jgi:hypothetical protein
MGNPKPDSITKDLTHDPQATWEYSKPLPRNYVEIIAFQALASYKNVTVLIPNPIRLGTAESGA